MSGAGTKAKPWKLKTPPGTADYGAWRDDDADPRGRFAMYVPPVLEALGLAEVEHNAKNNRMRSKK